MKELQAIMRMKQLQANSVIITIFTGDNRNEAS